MSTPKSKQCTRCGEEKPISDFNRHRKHSGGYEYHCRQCQRAYKRAQYMANRERYCELDRERKRKRSALNPKPARRIGKDPLKVMARRKRYYAQNPEKHRRLAREYYAENADVLRQKALDRIAAEPEKHRQRRREYIRNNPDKIREQSRSYRERNREKIRARSRLSFERQKTHVQARRAKKRNNGGRYTVAEWRDLCDRYGNICLCCGQSKPLTPDHVVPIAHGGTSNIDNIQPLCIDCNKRKAIKHTDYRKEWESQWLQLPLF